MENQDIEPRTLPQADQPGPEHTAPGSAGRGQDEPANIEQTLPTARPASPPPPDAPPKKRRRMPWPVWMLLGILILALIAVASGFSGYNTGIRMRESEQATRVAGQLGEQFDLAVQDMSAGRYELAYQRLTYINQHNPNFPGVIDLLVEVQLKVNTTATATLAPTPTLTPTPDLRGVEELVAQSQQAIANSEWTRAIDTLLALRKSDPEYQAVMVDDLLYVAYRNRGRDKILKEADLEGGIYDLTLAERFGPLDAESKGYLTWAGLYITGASFWEIDWAQAVYYFAQIAPALPNLRDGSGWTATERYRIALVGYGDDLMKAEQWCDAAAQYELAVSMGSDESVQEKLNEASKTCSGESDEEEEGDGDEGGGEPEATATPLTTP